MAHQYCIRIHYTIKLGLVHDSRSLPCPRTDCKGILSAETSRLSATKRSVAPGSWRWTACQRTFAVSTQEREPGCGLPALCKNLYHRLTGFI